MFAPPSSTDRLKLAQVWRPSVLTGRRFSSMASRQPLCRYHHHLMTLRSGTGVLERMGAASLPLLAPAVVLVQPGQAVVLVHPSGAVGFTIEFSCTTTGLRATNGKTPLYWESAVPAIPLDGFTSAPIPLLLPNPWAERADLVVLQCHQLWWRSLIDGLRADSLLTGLLAGLVEAYSKTVAESAEGSDLMVRILEHARSCLAQGCRVEDLAALAGWTRPRFSAWFTSFMGMSPGRHLRGLRLAQAKRLLHEKAGDDLEAVARNCGYSSGHAMARAFKADTGVTPGAWRARMQGTAAPDPE